MKRFGLIGHPLGHSLSPQIHKRIMEIAGIRGDYRLFGIAPENLDRELPALLRSLDGFNCTIPHKLAVVPHLARLADSARNVGAVNTIETKTLTGHNTDITGFEASCGIRFGGKNVLLLGAGGTARAFASAALANGAKSLALAVRNPQAASFPWAPGAEIFPLSDSEIRFGADVILNATPVGMWPNCGGMPAGIGLAKKPGAEVFDAIYNPVSTRLILNARKHGARAVGGLRMLVRQAIEAQKIWNPGAAVDAEKIESAILPELVRELLAHFPVKILLTGFMGAGKSAAGKILAKRLGFAFADSDDEIVKRTARAIPEIFASDGEAGFRAAEREAASALLSAPGSAVIASGGGFPTLPENRELARAQNALVFNLALPFDAAWQRAHSDTGTVRPLARDYGGTKALFEKREPVYRQFCDFEIDATGSPEKTADEIAAVLTAV